MPIIEHTIHISAPIERVFDLVRSIDAHVESTRGTGERAVAGVTSGLISEGQTVTWEARHFGVVQRLSVRITRMQRPNFFEDEMVSGAFRRMHHQHRFVVLGSNTEMTDRSRACVLKRIADSDEWRRYLP